MGFLAIAHCTYGFYALVACFICCIVIFPIHILHGFTTGHANRLRNGLSTIDTAGVGLRDSWPRVWQGGILG